MENVEEYLYQILAATLFIIATLLWLYNSDELLKLFDTTKDIIVEEELLYETNEYTEGDQIISYNKLLAVLMEKQEYNIEVDGILIEADAHNSKTFDYTILAQKDYKKIYKFYDGKIEKIVYEKVN